MSATLLIRRSPDPDDISVSVLFAPMPKEPMLDLIEKFEISDTLAQWPLDRLKAVYLQAGRDR